MFITVRLKKYKSLEKKGIDSSEDENKYQKLAGIDAKDGLVLFNLESINSA